MILTLGLFQLENLSLSRAPFHLIDLRLMPQVLNSPRVQACLREARVVEGHDLEDYLKRTDAGADSPVILLCEDGRRSLAEAQKLADLGFTQVYVVEGGTDGLLRETDDLPSSGRRM